MCKRNMSTPASLQISLNESVVNAIATKVGAILPNVLLRVGDESFAARFPKQRYNLRCFHNRTDYAFENESIYSPKWAVHQEATVAVEIAACVFEQRSQTLSLRTLDYVVAELTGWQPFYELNPVYAIQFGQERVYDPSNGATEFVVLMAIGNIRTVNGAVERLTPIEPPTSTRPIAIFRP
ncbi:MAG: hypothetical protein ACRC62_15305 [Microcoleus sp.]